VGLQREWRAQRYTGIRTFALITLLGVPCGPLAEGIGQHEFRAIIQFVLIALVLLPILSNRTYGPYDVVNPFNVWLIVALIVGLNLVSYLSYLLVGVRAGALPGGVFGGMISSAATTVSYARQTSGRP